ncbi:MAG: EpsG family protein, partial [Bdellovibrionales bacterium]|nr:EpsG family protein [Bdellovibrionales bacterium]
MFILYFFVLLVFMGLRDKTGADWYGYLNIYNITNSYSATDLSILKTEQAFLVINRMSDAMGLGIYGVNFVCALLFLTGVFSYAITTSRPWLALGVVIPYLTFIIGMSGIRQAAALGISFFALARWARLSLPSKLILIVLAAEFHAAAVSMLVFIIMDGSGRTWLRIVLVGFLMAVLLSVSAGQDMIDTYNT